VTREAAIAAPHMRERNVTPDVCSWWSTIRLVRFDPGRKSDEAFDINTAP
jgi:hypothetical protein